LVGEAEGGVPGLADRLNHLFATVPRSSRQGLWTNEQASAALAAGGTYMSDGYLSQLRSGKRNNPSARNLAAIAELFAVPVDYFFNPETAAKIDADLRLLVAVRDVGVQDLALRAHGLSAESLAGLAGIIEQVRKLEHVGEPSEDDNAPPVE
jgi:hypothetical protein